MATNSNAFARDRDDDIKAYREHLRLLQQALYGSGLLAQAVSQARGDGAFSELASVLDRYAQLSGFLSVAENGISAEDNARLASIRHENICRYHEAFLDGNYLCIVMEFAPNGDLGRFINKGREFKKVLAVTCSWEHRHARANSDIGLRAESLLQAFPEDLIWNYLTRE